MGAREVRAHRRPWTAVLLLTAFGQGCSALPQLVRHSDPLTAEEHVQLGNSYEEQGLHDRAIEQFQEALHLQKNNAVALNNLAMVYLAAGKDLSKAERWAQMALNQGGPLKPYVLDTLATIYIQEHRYPEARKALDEAARAAPTDNKALGDQLAKSREHLKVRSAAANSGN